MLKSLMPRLRSWARSVVHLIRKLPKHYIYFGIVVVLSLTVTIVLVARLFVDRPGDPNPEPPAIVNETPSDLLLCPGRRAIDGICFDKEDTQFPVAAMMVDNTPEARPQFGIANANLVYEAIAEGTITRFLAVFDLGQALDKIGPVRSARQYYVDWAEEFGGLYGHVGGSPEALDYLKKSTVIDTDQFFAGNYYWRDQQRYAPHNVMTSTKLLNELIVDRKLSPSTTIASWIYKPELALELRPETTQTIFLDFGSASYRVSWSYDREHNEYVRSQGGVAHKDAYGTVVRAKNVAIMYTKSSIYDDYGRRRTLTVGSGQADVFRDGEHLAGRWKRDSRADRTRFYDEAGTEIEFNPGITWIEVMPEGNDKAEYTIQ